MGFKAEAIDKFAALITGGFGLVAALAWNSAIQKLFEQYPLLTKGGQWVYAIVVTMIAVVATIHISRVASRVKAKEEEESKGKK